MTGPGGLDETLTVTTTNNVNAGTATANASYAETANYKGSSDSETFTIGKADTTTTVTCTAGPFTYNGSAHTPCSADVTGPNNLNETLTVSYPNNVNAGTATANASYAETANYKGSSDSETFTIGKAATITTVSCTAGPFTYNGLAQEPCSASVTGDGGLDESAERDLQEQRQRRYGHGHASYAETANYKGSSDSETFTIGKADTTTTVTCTGWSVHLQRLGAHALLGGRDRSQRPQRDADGQLPRTTSTPVRPRPALPTRRRPTTRAPAIRRPSPSVRPPPPLR